MSRKQNRQQITFLLDHTQFEILINTIQNLIKVIAATQIKLDKGTEYNAKFLKVFNLTDQEIANLLGVDRTTVTKALKSKQKKSSE
jgi:CRP-like cAMP-binding protein